MPGPVHRWSEDRHCLLAEIWKSDSASVCQAQFIGGLRIDTLVTLSLPKNSTVVQLLVTSLLLFSFYFAAKEKVL